MYYTYILKSKKQAGAIYIGHTADLKKRLVQHNTSSGNRYSKRHAPWEVESYKLLASSLKLKRSRYILNLVRARRS